MKPIKVCFLTLAVLFLMTVGDQDQRVIKQYFPLENLVFVLVGKASEIEAVAKKYATKFETKSITQPGL